MTHGAVCPSREDIRMREDVNSEDILRIVENHGKDRGGLIAILEEIQAEYGYLPEEALRMVGERTGRSLVDIYGLATFYRSFSLQPRGRHSVTVCLGTACHVRGAPIIRDEFEKRLGVKVGETTADKEFTLETVNCMGACALGPVVVIDGRYFSKVRKSKVKQLIKDAVEGFDKIEIGKDARIFPIEVSCPHCSHSLMDKTFAIDGYPSIRVAVSFGNKHGWLRLSSLYGSHNVATEYGIPADTVVDFFCPRCHEELSGASICPVCDAPIVLMIVRGGGVLRICARRGCEEHKLDLVTPTDYERQIPVDSKLFAG